jgi:cytochrome c oxidase subunit I+III
MIIATMARTPLVAYNFIVVALIATGFFSFGLWVHHMFTTGIPHLSLGFFSAASMAVSLPSGIQVFAWIATIAGGRLQLTVASLFVLGFLFIFTLGGLTGVMVAMVPFDWQVHDTYFVVAHFHYVLVGGMVFPLFAAFYYWTPAFSRRALSERLGTWGFWLMFIGFNVAFFPMHLTGLLGMPRRVFTYPAGLGWDVLNLVSTAGAFMLAAGVLVVLVDLVRNLRPSGGEQAGNLWGAGTLEWLPNDTYAARSVPYVTSREPLWDQPGLAKDVEAGRYYLPGTATGWRESIVTSPIEAMPQYLSRLPDPGWTPLLAAVFTAAFFLLLTGKLVTPAVLCALAAVVMMVAWMWQSDPAPVAPVDIGGGVRLPTYASGPVSHSWWAMVVLLLVAGSLYLSYVFSYLYLWTVSPQVWPEAGSQLMPTPGWPLASGGLLIAASATMLAAGRVLSDRTAYRAIALIVIAVVALAASLGVEFYGHRQAGLRADANAYGAMVSMAGFLQFQLVLPVICMAGFAIARRLSGRLDHVRRVTFDNLALLCHYAVGQGLLGLLLVHGFPRVVA